MRAKFSEEKLCKTPGTIQKVLIRQAQNRSETVGIQPLEAGLPKLT
jgi:hypothetical protein